MATDEEDDGKGVRVEAVFSYTSSGEFEVQQMYFGMRPAILITPHEDARDVVFQVRAVDLDPPELVKLLKLIAKAVKKAHKRAEAEEAEEAATE